jgi:FixJ family two-component response regulator
LTAPREHAAFPANLTPAERRAVQAVIEHGEDKRAANALGVSVSTLRSQTHAARAKAGVSCTVRLVVLFMEAQR